MTTTRGARTLATTAALLVVTVACSDAPRASPDPAPGATSAPPPTTAATPAPGTAVGIPDPDTIDPSRLAPLAGLPACPTASPAANAESPPEVPLPSAATVVKAGADGSLQSVQGTVARTPVEVMVDYLRRPGIEVVAAEDEVFESEVLLLAGDLRVFVKAQATCARGSAFVLFASTDPALVPVPAGTGP